MKRLMYLGTLVAILVVGLSMGSLAGAQEATVSIPEPQPSTPVETPPAPGEATVRIPEPQPSTPVDQYNDAVVTIPTPQPSTPVEGPATGPSDVTVLPDTGGMNGLTWMAGALLLGGGLVVRRIIK